MANLLKLRDEHKRTERALEECENVETYEEIGVKYEKYLIEHGEPFDAQKSKEYRKFKQQLDEITKSLLEANNGQESTDPQTMDRDGNGDGDMIVEESEINTLDPFTKAPMKKPMRNTHCGHYYEKESILLLLKGKNKVKCAVAGCGNNRILKASDLVEDLVFQKKLEDIYNEQQTDS